MFQHRINLDEKRLRTFVETEPALSETAASLSAKLGVNSRTARRVLDRYAEIGVVQRRTFGGRIEPVYYRYSTRAS
jgi:Fic family protein